MRVLASKDRFNNGAALYQEEGDMVATRLRTPAFSLNASVLMTVAVLFGLPATQGRAAESDFVIEITVDGLGSSYLQALIAGNQLPNFQRLQNEGVSTTNARCDYDISVTLPNHTSIVTGRGVAGPTGHNWGSNSDPPPGVTIHSNKGSYVASIFDVAHDNGLSTAVYTGKSKLSLFDVSYDAVNGAPDTTGVDNGQDKLDTFVYNSDTNALTSSYIAAMSTAPFNYSLLHLRNPDAAGSWGSTNYNNAVKTVDGYLGSIFDLVETNPALKDRTTIIVTADHGGFGNSHGLAFERNNYTIPFYVWGAGAGSNLDLYGINTTTRQNPGTGWVDYAATPQPIRNSDGANLALGLLGLGAIPGSTINASQDLALQGSGANPQEIFAYSAFNEVPIGVQGWTPGVADTELGFATTVIEPNLSATTYLGTYDSETQPRRFRLLGCEASTAFQAVDLTDFVGAQVTFDAFFKNTSYESEDYFRAVLTNGTDTITLAELYGDDLNALFKYISYPYGGAIPDDWTQATLIISSRMDDVDGSEGMDIDNIFFTGTRIPEPTSVYLLALAGLMMCPRRPRFAPAEASGRAPAETVKS
jgi:hypothetical protein